MKQNLISDMTEIVSILNKLTKIAKTTQQSGI